MSSYKNIAKSTGLIGLVQAFQILFGVVRNKVIALLLGTAGFGVWSLYNSYIQMITQFSILGLDKSGVRQISKNSKDVTYIPKVIYVFRNSILVVSLIATIVSIFFAKNISQALFKTPDYSTGVIIVSFSILFNSMSSGQKSILNGLRDLRGLAISQILGTVLGTIVCVLAVYFLREKGIPFYIFTVAFVSVIFTWWFTKKLNIEKIKPEVKEFKSELGNLLKLGLSFSVSGAVAALMTYLSRIYLASYFDIETVGIYQSSWTISNLYVGMILGAMGVDLMPRLMKIIDDKSKIRKAVNEQMELGVLVSSIGIAAILLSSSLILNVLYSDKFSVGESVIRWHILGVSLRLLAFPLSYAIVAKEKVLMYIFVQTVFWVADYLLLILFSNLFGFDGLGLNFFIAYIVYFTLCWLINIKIIDFRPSKQLIKIIVIAYSFIAVSYFCYFLPLYLRILTGGVLILLNYLWINKILKDKMGINIREILIRYNNRKLKK
jgi:antigen flippase